LIKLKTFKHFNSNFNFLGDSGGGLFLEEEDHTLLIGVVSGSYL